MAGRGTDIVLGGSLEAELAALGEDAPQAEKDRVKAAWQERHEAVKASGGLHIIGTERHESRRIDNQLRGRSGRQGDPGSSQFFISMQDDLMRLFGTDKISGLIDRMGLAEDEPIEAKMLTGQIENAQKRVEGRNYEIRKNVLQYDDVMNEQRKEIYAQRREVLEGLDMRETIAKMADTLIETAVGSYFQGARGGVQDHPEGRPHRRAQAGGARLLRAARGGV